MLGRVGSMDGFDSCCSAMAAVVGAGIPEAGTVAGRRKIASGWGNPLESSR